MSVAPAEDTLIVALDCEGEIQSLTPTPSRLSQISGTGVRSSLERSDAEDRLLVILNTAISNLVCSVTLSSFPFYLTVFSGSLSQQLRP
jgi:hypothetical protein